MFNDDLLSGNELYNIAKDNKYYMIFVTLMAFNKGETIQHITNYKEFIDSDCKIFLTVYDCSGVIILSKDIQLISMMYSYAQSKGYENVNYISEKELIEGIIDDKFIEMIHHTIKPQDIEINNKMTPFFSIFFENGFSSEHYGTEFHILSVPTDDLIFTVLLKKLRKYAVINEY